MSNSSEKDLPEIFELEGIFYKIKQDKYEPREVFNERVWFILNEIKQKSGLPIEKLITKSRIEANKKFLQCRYN